MVRSTKNSLSSVKIEPKPKNTNLIRVTQTTKAHTNKLLLTHRRQVYSKVGADHNRISRHFEIIH